METGTDIYDSLECNRKWTPMKQMQARKKVEDHGAAKVGLPLALASHPFLNSIPISFRTSNCATRGMSNERETAAQKGKTIFRFNQF